MLNNSIKKWLIRLVIFGLTLSLFLTIQNILYTPELHVAVTDIIIQPSIKDDLISNPNNLTFFSLTVYLSYWNEKTSAVRIYMVKQFVNAMNVYYSNNSVPQLIDNNLFYGIHSGLDDEQEYGFSPVIKPGETSRNFNMWSNQFNELPHGNYTFIPTSGEVTNDMGTFSLWKKTSPILLAAKLEINSSGSYLDTQPLPVIWGKILYLSSPLVSFFGGIFVVILFENVTRNKI